MEQNYNTNQSQSQMSQTSQAPSQGAATPSQPQAIQYQEEPCPPKGSIYEPISVGRYMLLILLAAIPVVNVIIYVIWAISERNVNIRNYAKAALMWIVIAFVLSLLIWGIFGAMIASIADY